ETLWADPECRVVTVTREEEGVGLLAGAWLAGRRGALLMQNSGLGNSVNALASPCVASQIPMVLLISHRGDLGEFNPAQGPQGHARRPRRPRHPAHPAGLRRRPRDAGGRPHQARLHALAPRRHRAVARADRRQAGMSAPLTRATATRLLAERLTREVVVSNLG